MSTLTTLIGHSSHAWCSSSTVHSSHLVTCSSDETVRVWGVQGGQQVACIRAHMGVVRGCHFSPDSTLLASCSWDKSILIHRTTDFQLTHRLLGHAYGVSYCQFSPSGHLLGSCSWDDNVGLWDVSTGQLLQMLQGHTSPVAACSFSPGGSKLATCSWDGTIKIWDLSLPDSPLTLEGHPDAVYDVSCCPTDGNLLTSCGRKGVMILWDLRARAPWHVLQKGWKETNCVTFSPDGSQIATGNDFCELHLWNMNDIKSSSVLSAEPLILHGHARSVTGCSYSCDGHYLATTSCDHTCRIWDLTRPSEATVTHLADSLASGLSLRGEPI